MKNDKDENRVVPIFEIDYTISDMDYKITKKLLNWCQERVNKFYEKKGLTDKVLEFQIRINRLRHVLDIKDEETVITDDGYVQ